MLIKMLILLTILSIPDPVEDFVPKDIAKAVAFGCVVWGDKGPPPFAEVQVFVKTTLDNPNFDYKPIVARYTIEQGGVFKAADECIEWNKHVKARIEADATNANKGASK